MEDGAAHAAGGAARHPAIGKAMHPTPVYVDPVDGSTYPIEVPIWRSDAGRPLLISAGGGLGRDDIDTANRSIWRYSAALPIAVPAPVSLGEGCTPLVERAFGAGRALFKLEWFAPTGSFKDRGASVMVSVLRQQGVRRILEDSSGNGGSAIAAYAAAAGIGAKIVAPASTQPSKIVQTRAHGAEVELIPGTRQDTADAAVAQSAAIFYASHNWQAFFLQGTKTVAYELWEDLGFRAPDNVIIPTGAGSNVLGCDIGFGELIRRGAIDRLPRLFAVQPENCGPIAASVAAGTGDVIEGGLVAPTIAEGAAIARPVRPREVLAALRRSGGGAVAVSEAEITAAVFDLASQGLYAEPTSAMAAAGLAKLWAAGTVSPGETTVVLLTGTGAKATAKIAELLEARA